MEVTVWIVEPSSLCGNTTGSNWQVKRPRNRETFGWRKYTYKSKKKIIIIKNYRFGVLSMEKVDFFLVVLAGFGIPLR
jgi:hypothetical protein